MPSSPNERFFFGWLEFDFTPDESGNIPGFGKFETELSQNLRGR
jgi:hypothetical protein